MCDHVGGRWLVVLLLVIIPSNFTKSIGIRNVTDFKHRMLKDSYLPNSVTAWLSSASPSNEAKPNMVSKVERRVAPIDGGATIIYTPNALQRGEYHLDTSMSCIGWRETVDCDPYTSVVSTKPASCNYNVDSSRSGYCECQVSSPSGPIVRFGHASCGHPSFRCHDVCKLPPIRQCRGFTLMDTCEPLPAGQGERGWDFLNSKATTCNVNHHNTPLGSVPSCWRWEPLGTSISCHEVINSSLAGYCECGSPLLRPEASSSGGASRVRLECGHTPLSCAYVCNSDPQVARTTDVSPHLPKDRYTPPPPTHLTWAWHARPGIWSSINTDFTMTDSLTSTSTSTNGRTAVSGINNGFQYQKHCEEAFEKGGHGAGGAGCIGRRAKWTLSSPLSQELRRIVSQVKKDKAALEPWKVGLGIPESSSTMVAQAQVEALLAVLGQSNNMFDQLPSCAQFAAIGDCTKCPLACGALLLNLNPTPELCFPPMWSDAFTRRPTPTSDDMILATVQEALPNLSMKDVLLDQWRVEHGVDNSTSTPDMDAIEKKATYLQEMGTRDAGDVVSDYLRGLGRTSTMKVVMLAYVSNFPMNLNKFRNNPHISQTLKSSTAEIWKEVLHVLSESLSYFSDYRVLLHVNNFASNLGDSTSIRSSKVRTGDLKAAPPGLKQACENVTKIHCQAMALPLRSVPLSIRDKDVSSTIRNEFKQQGFKPKKGRKTHGARRQLSQWNEKDENVLSYEESSAMALAKAELLTMYKNAENGKLQQFDAVILFDATEAFNRILKKHYSQLEANIMSSSSYFANEGHTLPATSPTSQVYSALGWDPNMLVRSLGRVSPLGGFDVLCAAPTLHVWKDENEDSLEGPFTFGGSRFAQSDSFPKQGKMVQNPMMKKHLFLQEGKKGRRSLFGEVNQRRQRKRKRSKDSCRTDKLTSTSHTNLIRSESCFNGLAVYNPQGLKHCEYSKYVHSDVCEHLKFDQCLVGSGFGCIYIDPLLTHVDKGFVPERQCVQLDNTGGAVTPPVF